MRGIALQIVRTIIWVLLLVGVLVFSFFNWNPVEVTIWDNLVVETKVPALVIISFLIGFVPIWLYSRGVIWSLNRKIRSLEIAAKANSVSAAARESDREEAERVDHVATPPQPEPEPEPEPETTHDDGQVDGPVAEEETRLTADDTVDDSTSADDTTLADDTPTVSEPDAEERADAGPEGDKTTQDKSTTT